ncbi:nitroreductase family protein [Moorellaceae bacterium AZ2]
MSEVLQIIKNRRSVRSYKDRQVEDKDLEAVLEAGSYAPSPGGSQPWHFTVVQDKELIRAMSEAAKEVARSREVEFLRALGENPEYHAFHGAPTVIVVSGDETQPFAPAACAAATQNMLLAAEALGLGSCWVNFGLMAFEGAKADHFRRVLGIPEGYKPLYSVCLGYRKEEKPPAAPRKSGVISYVRKSS